jgi:hypothetical protein
MARYCVCRDGLCGLLGVVLSKIGGSVLGSLVTGLRFLPDPSRRPPQLGLCNFGGEASAIEIQKGSSERALVSDQEA